MKKLITYLCALLLLIQMALPCMATDGERIQVDTEVLSELVEEAEGTKETAADLGITALAAVLMEAETGTVLYERTQIRH